MKSAVVLCLCLVFVDLGVVDGRRERDEDPPLLSTDDDDDAFFPGLMSWQWPPRHQEGSNATALSANKALESGLADGPVSFMQTLTGGCPQAEISVKVEVEHNRPEISVKGLTFILKQSEGSRGRKSSTGTWEKGATLRDQDSKFLGRVNIGSAGGAEAHGWTGPCKFKCEGGTWKQDGECSPTSPPANFCPRKEIPVSGLTFTLYDSVTSGTSTWKSGSYFLDQKGSMVGHVNIGNARGAKAAGWTAAAKSEIQTKSGSTFFDTLGSCNFECEGGQWTQVGECSPTPPAADFCPRKEISVSGLTFTLYESVGSTGRKSSTATWKGGSELKDQDSRTEGETQGLIVGRVNICSARGAAATSAVTAGTCNFKCEGGEWKKGPCSAKSTIACQPTCPRKEITISGLTFTLRETDGSPTSLTGVWEGGPDLKDPKVGRVNIAGGERGAKADGWTGLCKFKCEGGAWKQDGECSETPTRPGSSMLATREAPQDWSEEAAAKDDPVAFQSTMKNYVSANPVSLHLPQENEERQKKKEEGADSDSSSSSDSDS